MMPLKNNAPSSWTAILSDIDKNHKFTNKIVKIGDTDSSTPSPYMIILKANFEQFGPTLDIIIKDLLKFQEYTIKSQKIREAVELKMLYSRPYSFEVAETKAIEILELVEAHKFQIECCIKKTLKF